MRVLPLIYIEHFTEDEVAEHECSDRIWLGQRTYERLMNAAEPGVANMLTVLNDANQSVVGCVYGVHYGDEELLYLPQWMYEELVCDSENITIHATQPGLCTGIMIQPHTSEHVSAADPQELLRDAFERYSCLIPGTTIPLWLESLHTKMYVTVLEVRPHTNEVRSIRNSEIELELMRPLDMPLPAPPPIVPAALAEPEPEPVPALATPFGGGCTGQVLGGGTSNDARSQRERMAAAARARVANLKENSS